MSVWKHLLIPLIALCLLNATTLWAAEVDPSVMEQPSFQNPTQAERARDMALSSFTEDDMEKARDEATDKATIQVETLSENYANGVVEQISSDSAYMEIKQLSRDHAITAVDTEAFPNIDARATFYADKLVEEKAQEYASGMGAEDTPEYKEAYDAAMARATGPSFDNLWDTAYKEAIAKALEEDFDNWQEAYDYAYQRATGEGYKNAYDTARESYKEKAMTNGVWQDAFDYAYARATDPNFSNAYQAEYKKALETAVADITGEQLRRIHQMRYVEKLGLGVISKKVGLHPSINGRGNTWKHPAGPSIDDEIIPSGPEPEELSLEKEIAEATRRNTRTGWNVDQEFQAKGNKNKGSKKVYGLAQTSGIASEDVRGKNNEKNGNGKNKSSFGNSVADDVSNTTQEADSSISKNNNGNSNKSEKSNKSDNSSNGNKGGKSSSNGNKGGNSGNNGNSGGNGKSK